MRIIDKIKADGVHISFEVFPPKTDAGFESVLKATDGIAELTPSFISVTYGAGGGTSKNTVKIASHIKNDLKIPALAHLTCVSSTKEEVHKVIGQLQKKGLRISLHSEEISRRMDSFRFRDSILMPVN